ncbi:hypothetical protein KAJ61_05830 [Candidatus Parcubacteria bacterium]|nr:hypothetical protein [Candidatus Parcubacteria bacterium]
MKYFLRKIKKFETDKALADQFKEDEFKISDKFKIYVDAENLQYLIEEEIDEKDKDKQVKDDFFDSTRIHICKHEEGLPCELIDL